MKTINRTHMQFINVVEKNYDWNRTIWWYRKKGSDTKQITSNYFFLPIFSLPACSVRHSKIISTTHLCGFFRFLFLCVPFSYVNSYRISIWILHRDLVRDTYWNMFALLLFFVDTHPLDIFLLLCFLPPKIEKKTFDVKN